MRSMTRAAFGMLLLATLFLLLGWVMPFWFARGTNSNNGIYWNIFYWVVCIASNCNSEGQILKKSLVFIGGVDTDVELEAISVTAIVAFAFCCVAVLLACVFQCALCGHRTSYFYLILGALLCMIFSSILGLVSIILAAVALDDFFDIVGIQNAFEFPWSVMFFGFGALLMGVAALLYGIILNRWKRYRHIYSEERYYFESPEGPIFTVDRPDYDRKGGYIRNDSIRRSYRAPKDYYPRDDVKRMDNWDDYRRDYRDDYRDDYRKSYRPSGYDRRFAREYRKPSYYYDRYREEKRYSPYYYGGTRYDRPWHSKLDDMMDEAYKLRDTYGYRNRDRDYYY